MDLPSLRHFGDRGIFHIYSDPVEALVGEAWVLAIYTDKGWATADGGTLITVAKWRHAAQEGQIQGCSISQHKSGDESGQTAKASNSNRTRKSRQKPQG
ncbi:MAG: hypothetical protein ACO20L_10640 [Candidatus Puniceispirillaceae bacterium]